MNWFKGFYKKRKNSEKSQSKPSFVSRFLTIGGENGNERKRNWKRAGNEADLQSKPGNEPFCHNGNEDPCF